MKLAIDGGKRTVPPVTAWAVIDFYTEETWGGILDPDYTSNQAEYYGLINAMKIAIDKGEKKILLVQSDSELLVKHVNGEYRCKDPKLQILLSEVRRLALQFEDFLVYHVLRDSNVKADLAVNQVMDAYISGR